MSKVREIKIGSDFSGVGAFNMALQRLNIPYQEVFACDMDKYARQTFIENHGEPQYFPWDVYERAIPTDPLDIYMTSPPCQAFSLAGRRKGEDDKRGILFYNSHEFIKTNKPRFFIFENVKGLLSDDKGNTFAKWVQYLGGKSVNGLPVLFPHEEATPYHLYWRVLNAKHYNIPQNRERVFIVGIRNDQDNHFNWPIEVHLKKKLKHVLESKVDEKYLLSEKGEKFVTNKMRLDKKYTQIDGKVSLCLTAKGNTNWTGSFIKVAIGSIVGRPIHNPKCRESGHPTKQMLEVNQFETSNALTTVQKDNVVVEYDLSYPYRIRRLTPKEAFRLMDFPDSFKWSVSDTQAYKQAGNSICVGVLAGIIKNLKNLIK